MNWRHVSKLSRCGLGELRGVVFSRLVRDTLGRLRSGREVYTEDLRHRIQSQQFLGRRYCRFIEPPDHPIQQRTLRANIDETVLLVVITEQGENRNQCEEQRNVFGFPHGFARRGT